MFSFDRALKVRHELMEFDYNDRLDCLLVSVDRVLVLNPGSHYPACPSPWGHPSLKLVCHQKPSGQICRSNFLGKRGISKFD